ncbi:MAG: hypothetical protein H6816_00360 [Phycisphaerales bacterium]|nr:hypothetical protein [Phycisphaerales bacterium]
MRPAGTILALFALLPAVTRADDGDIGTFGPREAAGIARISGIAREVQRLGDWENIYEEMAPGVDAFWQQQGWNDEADRFALETFHEVASVPPWQVAERINRLLGAVRSRYALTEDQYLELQTRTYSFLGAMAWRHGRTLYSQTKEAVETRLDGEPFTPQQVARWTRDSRDVLDDARAQVERVSGEFARTFTPDQRDIFERDMESYHRRMETVDKLRARWAAGGWRPEDWGLQNDPLYRKARTAAENEADSDGPAVDRFDELAWARYVREFVNQFQLDDAQATAAWSILDELLGRAADYRRLHRDEMADAADDAQAYAKLQAPIGELFDELKQRLRPIPTSAQRNKAKRDLRPVDVVQPIPGDVPEQQTVRRVPRDDFPPE